jgi:hypothetical protein
MTPAQWLDLELERLEVMADVALADAVEVGQGAVYLLAIADGLRALQAYCLATSEPVLLSVNGGSGGPCQTGGSNQGPCENSPDQP